jgi:hypothetical protein
MVALIEADAGYRASPHEHAHAEFFHFLQGVIKNQDQELSRLGVRHAERRDRFATD